MSFWAYRASNTPGTVKPAAHDQLAEAFIFGHQCPEFPLRTF
jgi:hypothetical protein